MANNGPPPYCFQIKPIGPVDSPKGPSADAQGRWLPPNDLGDHIEKPGTKNYRCDGRRIREITEFPAGCTGFKSYSFYWGVGDMWIVNRDVTLPGGDLTITWRRLSFDWPENSLLASYATIAGAQSRLRIQKGEFAGHTEERWVPMLLPEQYHSPQRTLNPSYGGMNGELPIIIALVAYSAHPTHRHSVMRSCFREGQWQFHAMPSGRYEGIGMVVTIWFEPPWTCGHLEAYEAGRYPGKMFD